MDCTKLCESQASQLFPESTTLTSIDLSVYDDTGGSDYYNEDPYGKYSHLVANKGIIIKTLNNINRQLSSLKILIMQLIIVKILL